LTFDFINENDPRRTAQYNNCLLYTSDAADEED